MVELTVTADTTNLSYWFNWRVLLCVIWVFSSMSMASYVIWRSESSSSSDLPKRATRTQELLLAPKEEDRKYVDDDAWRTCLKQIHPSWLLGFRVISFIVFLCVLIFDVMIHGATVLFFYYTQWTFLLVAIYFGLGSALSFYGCYQRRKFGQRLHLSDTETDSNNGGSHSYIPLSYGEATGVSNIGIGANFDDPNYDVPKAGIWGHLLQVLFQLIAGAVVLTDCVYWWIIFPFLTIYDYDLHVMTFLMHSLNAVFVLGDTALNCLPFPWFRISYFILWTGVFVIAQWIIHAVVSIRWPYPFLDLGSPYAPLWYLLVGLMQVPCYGIFVLIVEMKASLLSRWFPESCQCSR